MGPAARLLLLALCLLLPSVAGAAQDCTAPEPVCAAAGRVYRVSSFDPEASALLIAPGRLVTNRHVVADNANAEVILPDGRRLAARVVPSSYPGDLILLAVDGLDDAAPLPRAEATMQTEIRVAGADIGRQAVRVYAPGRLLTPKAGTPRARLHHDAESFPGNSGGALLDAEGNLVGIAASGGEGRNEAIPAAELDALEQASGPDHAEAHARISQAYVGCIEALDRTRGGSLRPELARTLLDACPESGNRQLIDLAGQAFGRAGGLEQSIALFERALEIDPHAVNARVGMAVSLHIAQRFEQEVEHLRWLMAGPLPADPLVLRYAVQAGKWGGAPDLAEEALARMEQHHPQLAPPARRFFETGPERPRGGPPK
jgi:hypothetical protein